MTTRGGFASVLRDMLPNDTSWQGTSMYPTLSTSYKNRFAFRLGTTSFIYPDEYVANVQLLAPRFDEIEILIFESRHAQSLPTRDEIAVLQELAAEFGIRYNVHLPYDVAPGGQNAAQRRQAVDTLRTVIALTRPLDPTSYTLHLACGENHRDPDAISRWKDRVQQSLEQIIGPDIPGRLLSIENLDYPLQWLDELIAAHDLSLCLDIGHLLIFSGELTETFARYRDRIALIHLHGVRGSRDHLSLEELTPSYRQAVANILEKYTGSVSLEVFRFDHLQSSLGVLEKLQHSWEDQTTPTWGREANVHPDPSKNRL